MAVLLLSIKMIRSHFPFSLGERSWRHRFDPWIGKTLGEGNGNLFQYPCLANPMDRGAWQGTVHGVIESQTRLSN